MRIACRHCGSPMSGPRCSACGRSSQPCPCAACEKRRLDEHYARQAREAAIAFHKVQPVARRRPATPAAHEPLVDGGCGRQPSELRDQAAVITVLCGLALTLSVAALAWAVIRLFV